MMFISMLVCFLFSSTLIVGGALLIHAYWVMRIPLKDWQGIHLIPNQKRWAMLYGLVGLLLIIIGLFLIYDFSKLIPPNALMR